MAKTVSFSINVPIHHITQIVSIILAYMWFGWHGLIIVFLINWAANTVPYTRK